MMQQQQDNNKFEMVVKTFKGLEDVLQNELIALGAENVELGNRMVSLIGDKEMMYRINFCARTALRVLKPIVKFTAHDTDELYDFVRDFDWEELIDPDGTFAIDTTVNSSEFSHSRYVTYRVKDAIVDHFTDKFHRRPTIRLNGADILLNVHISDTRVTISLDSSGATLNQRGYRVDTMDAPINEVLAAGIILKTGWRGESNFVDPMCGSGTFLIEAALIAANIWPGIYRKEFAFERWKDFEPELLEEIATDDSGEREFNFKIYGADIDPEAVAVTRKNIRQASLESFIELTCCPFNEWTNPPANGILITNPPYGERIRPENMAELYKSIGSTLKKQFAGYHAWILGYKEEHLKEIGLKPSVKFPLLNGELECQLNEYVLFDGNYSDFRAKGGSVGNKDFNRDTRPKVRHLSDDDWEQETQRFGTNRREKNRDRDRERPKRFRNEDRAFKDNKKRKDFKKNNDNRKPKRNDEPRTYRRKEATQTPDKGPSLPESSTVKLGSGLKMRSRKGWYKTNTNSDDTNNEIND